MTNVTTTASVQITVEINVPVECHDDRLLGQVRKQAKDAAIDALRSGLKIYGIGRAIGLAASVRDHEKTTASIIGEPVVADISFERGSDARANQTDLSNEQAIIAAAVADSGSDYNLDKPVVDVELLIKALTDCAVAAGAPNAICCSVPELLNAVNGSVMQRLREFQQVREERNQMSSLLQRCAKIFGFSSDAYDNLDDFEQKIIDHIQTIRADLHSRKQVESRESEILKHLQGMTKPGETIIETIDGLVQANRRLADAVGKQSARASTAVAELIRCGVAAGVLKESERTIIADVEWTTVADGVVERLKALRVDPQ